MPLPQPPQQAAKDNEWEDVPADNEWEDIPRPSAPLPNIKMQTSAIPKLVHGVADVLPVAGGLAGGVIGSGVGPLGTAAGGGLGAAAGMQGRALLENKLFGGPSPASKPVLKETGEAFAVGTLAELPGALAQGYGNVILRRLAAAKSSDEVGDVLEAFNRTHPFKVTAEGMKDALEKANTKLSGDMSATIRASGNQSTNLDQVIAPIRKAAAEADSNFIRGTRVQPRVVSNKVEEIIGAAKVKAGVKGNTATVQQLANMQREIQKIAYRESISTPSVGGVVQKIMKEDGYHAFGSEIDRLAPPVRPILDKMTNNHAAISALENYKPGTIKTLAISAAKHPKTSAAASSLAYPAATETGAEARRLGRLVPKVVP